MANKTKNEIKEHEEQPWFLIDELDRFLKVSCSKVELEQKKNELLSRYTGQDPSEFERDIQFSVLMHELYGQLDEIMSDEEIKSSYEKIKLAILSNLEVPE